MCCGMAQFSHHFALDTVKPFLVFIQYCNLAISCPESRHVTYMYLFIVVSVNYNSTAWVNAVINKNTKAATEIS